MSGKPILLIGVDEETARVVRNADFPTDSRDNIPDLHTARDQWSAAIITTSRAAEFRDRLQELSLHIPVFQLLQDDSPPAPADPDYGWITRFDIASGIAVCRILREIRLYAAINALDKQIHGCKAQEKDLALRMRAVDHARKLNADLVGSIPAGLIIMDISGMIILINEPARIYLDLESAELTGLDYRACLPDSARQTVARAVDDVQTLCFPALRRVRYNRRYLQVSGCKIVDYSAQTVGMLLFFQDVTEQENVALQLYRAEKLASLGTMLSGIAHELRNPLAIISARTQRARMRTAPEDEWMRKNLLSIEEQAERCAAIINGLLDFVRYKDLSPAIHRLDGIVEEVLTYASYQTSFDRISVDRSGIGETTVFGDRSRLVQAVLNIVLNAVESMNGAGNLAVTATGAAGWTTLRIGDTGPGIDPGDARKIFDPFFTTKDPGRGTGLGLSITQKIIQESDGDIWFESHPGDTTFFVKLPAQGRFHA